MKRHDGKTPRAIVTSPCDGAETAQRLAQGEEARTLRAIPLKLTGKCARARAPGHSRTEMAADAAVQGGNCFKNSRSSGAAL